jgi:hypothetical protein
MARRRGAPIVIDAHRGVKRRLLKISRLRLKKP